MRDLIGDAPVEDLDVLAENDALILLGAWNPKDGYPPRAGSSPGSGPR